LPNNGARRVLRCMRKRETHSMFSIRYTSFEIIERKKRGGCGCERAWIVRQYAYVYFLPCSSFCTPPHSAAALSSAPVTTQKQFYRLCSISNQPPPLLSFPRPSYVIPLHTPALIQGPWFQTWSLGIAWGQVREEVAGQWLQKYCGAERGRKDEWYTLLMDSTKCSTHCVGNNQV
jgi:hypothetical protein